MRISNLQKFSYRAFGPRALFTDPITKIGGEKFSYQVPTYGALIGLTKSIYWKPTIKYIIERVRVMKQIQYTSMGVRVPLYQPIKKGKGKAKTNDISRYTYLSNVEYQVEGHFEFDLRRPDLEKDRNLIKHHEMLERSISRGGRFQPFLGTSESQCYVTDCVFNTGEGFYDNYSEISFGTMVHSLMYPNETGNKNLQVSLWHPVMKKGIIEFPKPDECPIIRDVTDYDYHFENKKAGGKK